MKYFIGILSVVAASLVIFEASGEKSKSETFKVEGVGTVRVVHEDIGEPIAAPERVRVLVDCLKSSQSVEIKLFRLCKLDSVTYEAETKTLSLKLISARVVHNTGEVVCDQVDLKEIPLKNVCR